MSTSEASQSTRRTSIHWTTEMDNLFLELLLLHNGDLKKPDNGLRREQWNAISMTMRDRLQLDISIDNLKNHMKVWKRYINTYFELKRLSGFGWDPVKRTFEAPPQVWDDYIKGNKHAAYWRGRTLSPILEQVAKYMGDEIATGEDAFTFGDCQYVEDVGLGDLPTQMDTEENYGIPPSGPSFVGGQAQSSRKESKKRKGTSDKISQPLTCIAAVLDKMVQTLEEQSLSISRKEDKQEATCKSAIAEMLKLEGIDIDSRVRAITLLNSNEAHAKLFMELPTDLRLDWIMSLLHG